MATHKWTVVIGILLIAAVLAGGVLLQQRNDARLETRLSREQVAQRDRRITALNTSIQEQKNLLSVQAEQLQKKQTRLDAARSDITQAHSKISGLKQKMDDLDNKMTAITSERDRLEQANDTLSARIAELESDNAQNSNAIAMLNEEATKHSLQRVKFEKEIENLSSEVARKDMKLARTQDSLSVLESQTVSLNEDLSVVKESAGRLESRQKAMRETYEALVAGLKRQLDSKEASIEEFRQKLKVTFLDRILFGFSQVQISTEGKHALNLMAEALAMLPQKKISITGNADPIPISEKFQYRYPSNWELSSARAAAVARYLLDQGVLEPSRIEIIGRAHYHPVADNDTEAGRAKNRRVEIIIHPVGT